VDRPPQEMARERFEQWLAREDVGGYMFYSKLTDNEKAAVCRTYETGGSIHTIRAQIRELLVN